MIRLPHLTLPYILIFPEVPTYLPTYLCTYSLLTFFHRYTYI